MDLHIHLGWWVLPTAITVIALLWFMWASKDDDWGAVFLLIPVLFVCTIVWMFAAVLK